MQIDLTAKLKLTERLLLEEFPHELAALLVMGSITQEATPTSDIDVAVVYQDRYHREHIAEIKSRLRTLSAEINSRFPGHELVLWPSKLDHYRTFLPDVSYLRANLPSTIERLDAWCGLAKHTLLNYEASSCRVVYGELNFDTLIKRIPRREANELFLLATRTFAEGLAEIASAHDDVRRSGLNHIAKAGLRAAYSVLLRKDCEPRNSYRDITNSALEHLPEKYHALLQTLYEVKSGRMDLAPPMQPLLEFLRYCELQIADTAILEMVGLAKGSAGECFAFPAETIWREYAPVEQYGRFSGFEKNHLRSVYFLMTAQEIVERFSAAGISDCDQLDFYFEELTTLASFTAFNLDGLRLIIGQEERESIHLSLGLGLLRGLTSKLVTLAFGYLNSPGEFAGYPWLSMETKLARVYLLLSQVSQISDISCPKDLVESLGRRVGVEALLPAIEWQGLLFDRIFSKHILKGYSEIALKLYQAGQTDLAQKLLKSIVSVGKAKERIARELEIKPADVKSQIDKELSKATQYYAVTFHRQGDFKRAREEYLRALELDPDNHSALDDLATLLTGHMAVDESPAFLTELRGGFDEQSAEAVRQLANVFLACAVARKKNKEWRAAETWYLRAIEVDPAYEIPYYKLGVLANEQMNDPATARKLYRKAIDLNPLYVKPYVQLGIMLEEGQDYEGAIEVLTAAVRLGIADEYVETNLGNCYWRTGRLEAAARSYASAIERNERHADALNGLGVLLLEGDGSSDSQSLFEAAQFFRQAYEADPSFEGAKSNLLQTQALLANRSTSVAETSVSPAADAAPCERAYRACLEQAQIFRASAETLKYCECWLAFLSEAHESACPEYGQYCEEFVLSLAELYSEALCADGGKAEWQRVLYGLAGEAEFEPHLVQAVRFFEHLARGNQQGARDSIQSHPLKRVLLSTFLTAKRSNT